MPPSIKQNQIIVHTARNRTKKSCVAQNRIKNLAQSTEKNQKIVDTDFVVRTYEHGDALK